MGRQGREKGNTEKSINDVWTENEGTNTMKTINLCTKKITFQDYLSNLLPNVIKLGKTTLVT